jgi:hypothetical protein
MMNLPIPVLRRLRSLSFRLIGATALAALGTVLVLAPALSAAPVPVVPAIPGELPPSSALGDPILPRGWVLVAGFAAVAAALLTGLLIVRRRRAATRPVRLARPAAASVPATSVDEPARIDVQIDIVGATRSVMMFALEYRLELTNRADRGLGDVRIAAQLTCAQRGASNSAPAGAAQHLHDIARIGPQQSRAVDGIVRLPIADITILRQGDVPMFVPLLHVTIEGTGIAPITRSYAIGTPSAANFARLHPVVLSGQPGRIDGLRAQIVNIPDSEDSAG